MKDLSRAGKYAIYLRKSRADLEAEARGEGETLARHRRALNDLAARRGYNVVRTYEEIVSADTIAGRPQVQALLAAVEAGEYTGVLVNDADRLARGDGIDQGVMKQAFYSSGTLIITPFKTFDPSDPSDEDYFDFSMFMARFEYRKIKQRMQTGRARSAAEGNYLGTRVPFGYLRVKRADRAGYTLVPDPESADVVRMMYHWYAGGDSANAIAIKLNDMGVRTSLGYTWIPSTVRHTLQNPAYIGTSSWAKRVKRIRSVGGVRTETREVNPDPIIVEGAHEPLVDRETWDTVQRIFASHERRPKNTASPLVNPMAGLIRCALCGKSMQMSIDHPGVSKPIIKCTTRGCPTTSIRAEILELAILDALRGWIGEYSAPQPDRADSVSANPELVVAARQIDTLNGQLSRLHDFLEQGIYSPAEFVQRRDDIKARIAAAQSQLDQVAKSPTQAEIITSNLPKIKNILEAYDITPDAQARNAMLSSVIDRIIYHKTKRCTRADNPAEHLYIEIFARYIDHH